MLARFPIPNKAIVKNQRTGFLLWQLKTLKARVAEFVQLFLAENFLSLSER